MPLICIFRVPRWGRNWPVLHMSLKVYRVLDANLEVCTIVDNWLCPNGRTNIGFPPTNAFTLCYRCHQCIHFVRHVGAYPSQGMWNHKN